MAHQEAAQRGDSDVPPIEEAGGHKGLHFVAFVKSGGRLWELEGGEFCLVSSSLPFF